MSKGGALTDEATTTLRAVDQLPLLGGQSETKWEVNREALAATLAHTLQRLTLRQFVGLLTNEYEEIIEYVGLCEGAKAAQKTSLLFNPHRLATCGSGATRSIFDALQVPSFCDGLARASMHKRGSVRELLYQALQLGPNHTAYVNEFPPHVAREICLSYGLGLGSRVLDPCAGWGGRMIGCSTVVNSYTGFDPSSATAAGLQELSSFLRSFRQSFVADIACLPFEDAELPPAYYDLAITSPPYYDTERYSDEETNSCNRYADYDAWVDGFYRPLLESTLRALKPGAPFILNIGSRRYPLAGTLRKFLPDRKIRALKSYLSGGGGLGKTGEGETFYEILAP